VKSIAELDSCYITIDKELGNRTLGKPLTIGLNRYCDIGRFAVHRQRTEQSEHRTPAFSGLKERTTILCHLLVSETVCEDSHLGQNLLNKEVLFQDHLFTHRSAHLLKEGAWEIRPLLPCQWLNKRLHVSETLDGVTMTVSPMEAQRTTPVDTHKGDVLHNIEIGEQSIEIAALLKKAVGASLLSQSSV
jgi:hypothetical protein